MQFTYLRYDLYRYFYPTDDVSRITALSKVKIVLLTQGIWAISVYRLRRWAEFECGSMAVRLFMKVVGAILQLFIETATGITIESKADIGPGLYIGHYGNIFIGGDIKIGKLVNISQEVSVGYSGRGDSWGRPRHIGDCVYIAPGAKIVGKITIGNNVVVGANSVVSKSLPDNAVALGVPARIINYDSSRDFIRFNYLKNRAILEGVVQDMPGSSQDGKLHVIEGSPAVSVPSMRTGTGSHVHGRSLQDNEAPGHEKAMA